MEIHLSKNAGFCFGVRKAVEKALEISKTHADKTYMLGHIVHNEHVVNTINQAGVKVIQDIKEAEPGGVLLIRAHGTVPSTYQKAKDLKLEIVDATCPLVAEIHETVRQLHSEGYGLIIIGDHGHDEVVGIAGQVATPLIVSNPDEVDQLREQVEKLKKIGVVVQSTQNIDNVSQIIAKLAPLCRELKFVNTICKPTKFAQREIRQLPIENDVVIVVGSHTSANTTRLAEISKELNPRTYLVEAAEDLESEWFEQAKSVGVHGGASTPDAIIQAVVERIREIDKEINET